MSGVLRLGNTGAGTGRSTLVAAASNDQTFSLPSAGGTLLTSNTSIPGGTINLDGATINITNGDLNVDSGTLFVDESTNRVGIGTITPAALLQIDAGAGTDATLNLRMGTGNSGANESIISWVNSAGSEIFKTYFENAVGNAQFKVAATLGGAGDIVLVNRSGEVGLNTAPATGVGLTVINPNNASGSILLVSSTNPDGLQLTTRNDGAAVQIANNASGGAFRFYTNSSTDGRGIANSLVIEADTRDISIRSYNGSSGGLDTPTSAVLFRGGSTAQQADLIKINSGVETNWGGTLQLSFKVPDGSLNTNYGSLLRCLPTNNDNYNGQFYFDSAPFVIAYNQSINRTSQGETAQPFRRKSQYATNVLYAESAVVFRNTASDWGLGLSVNFRPGTGVSDYYFYRLYVNGQIGTMNSHNFYDISLHSRTVGGTSNSWDLDILNYNTGSAAGATLSFYLETVASDRKTLWCRFANTFQSYSLINMGGGWSTFDSEAINDTINWTALGSTLPVRTIQTT